MVGVFTAGLCEAGRSRLGNGPCPARRSSWPVWRGAASAEPGDLNNDDPFAADVGEIGEHEMATALGP